MTTHVPSTLAQLQYATQLYAMHPDPLLQSAITLLANSLSEPHLTPQQARAYALVENMKAAAATLYNDPKFLPDTVTEEW